MSEPEILPLSPIATVPLVDASLTTVFPPPTTLLLLVGGICENRLRRISAALQAQCPQAIIVCVDEKWPGYGWGYNPNLATTIQDYKNHYPTISRVVLVNHSMSWDACRLTCIEGVVNYWIGIDEVGSTGVDYANWPVNQQGILFKAAPTFPIRQCYIHGGPTIIDLSQYDHNEICESPEVFAKIVRSVEATA